MFYLNPYHLVQISPWPLIGALGALFLTSGLALWFHGWNLGLTIIGLIVILLTIYHWWRDVVRERTYQGYHTAVVVRGLKFGIVLFIISEVCFFFAFFWAFFHIRLSPDIRLGNRWPPRGIETLDPWGVPLLNTVILLSSGVTVTWAHHAILCGQRGLLGILFTVLLGVWFTFIQAREYMEVSFAISDRVFGSTFFVATGFHGLHVIIGTLFLFINLLRVSVNHFSTSHHVGFEAAAWYWHFVDVVWLFLFISIYYWGT